jgi:polyisoprenoid-binding protein YceI
MHKASAILGLALLLTGSSVSAQSTAAAASAAPGLSEWALDAKHAHIGFSVAHLVVSSVEGQFKKFTGKALLDEKDLTKSQLEFATDVASIDTENEDRDKHLKSAEFFDAEKFPQITFKSTKITKSGSKYKVSGDLTIHGVTKPVTLDAELSDAVTGLQPGVKIRAAKLAGQIKRSDFGITWNKTLGTDRVAVGDPVTLDIKLELLK